MRLAELVRDLPITAAVGDLSRPVAGLACHSRQVIPGGAFVAIPGLKTDGHDYLEQAVASGATTLVVERLPATVPPGVTVIQVEDARAALAVMATRYYQHPSRRLAIIGITGTNGKTTTSYMLESILAAAGARVGVIGTINIRYPGRELPAPITTPDSLELQRLLADMVAAGVTHVVMEVSSHGLDLHRVDGTRFQVGIFTNLSQDHLDYHGTMERYFAAKCRLFFQLMAPDNRGAAPTAVVNVDDPWGRRLYARLGEPRLCYGITAEADVGATRFQCSASGISARVRTPRGETEISSALLGRVNLSNILAATAAAAALDVDLGAIAAGIRRLHFVPGRLQQVSNQLGIQVVVDYAHTPDALAKGLQTMAELGPPRLICVFGCGGDRDRSKRPLMGAAAARWAQLVVVTSDNPRSEDPAAIIAEIERGLQQAGMARLEERDLLQRPAPRGYLAVVERRRAIEIAIDLAAPGDVVYIAGKGHETYQILGDRRIDFDDRVVAAAALAAKQAQPRPAAGSGSK